MREARPIRVCHLASGDLWAGAEVQIATLLCALKADPAFDLSAIVLNKGRLEEELTAARIPVTIYDESTAGALKIVRALVSHLTEHRPDIVHSHRYKEHILGAVSAKLSRIPIAIQTYHGLEEGLRGWAALKMNLYTGLNTISGNMVAKGFVGVSDEIVKTLQRRYPSGDVRCVHNGIDLDRVKPKKSSALMRERLGIPAGVFVVGTVCRLTPIKGIEYLIRAWASVLKTHGIRQAKLVIVGDGPLKAALEDLARNLGLTAETLFLGARTDVYDLMAAFDVFVLPSLHEGIPMVLLEAMAVGVPIIASDVGGIPEIVRNGHEARLVSSENVEALAGAICELENDSSLRDRLRNAAHTRVRSQFSIAGTATLIGGLYHDLVRDSGVLA